MKNVVLFLLIFCTSLMAQETQYFELIKKSGPCFATTCLDEKRAGQIDLIGTTKSDNGLLSMRGCVLVGTGSCPNGNIFFDGKTAVTLLYSDKTDAVKKNAGLTIEVWIFPLESAPGSTILSKPGVWEIAFSKNRRLKSTFQFLEHPGDLMWQEGNEIPTNTWSHIVVTFDQKQVTHYVNGQAGSVEVAGTIDTTKRGFTIGATKINEDYRCFFVGGVARVTLYDHVVCEKEILEHFQVGNEIISKIQTNKISLTQSFSLQNRNEELLK